MSHPSFQHAYVEERKIVEYLLSSGHERGKSKAFVFRRRGFSIASWHEFANALRLQALKADVIEEIEPSYSTRYNVDGVIQTPDGSNPRIRTIWQVDHGTNYPRLITAYPLD